MKHLHINFYVFKLHVIKSTRMLKIEKVHFYKIVKEMPGSS